MGNKIRQAYGVGGPTIPVFPIPVSAQRAPVSGQDTAYPQGQSWFDNSQNPAVEYVFDGRGVWVTGTPGSISSVSGTANQITAVTTSGAVALSVPSTFVAPGSIASTTTLTGGTGVTATTGNFVASAAGAGIQLNSGTASGTTTAALNGRSGQITITTPTINAGATFTFTISNTSVTASTTQILYGLTGGTTGSAITIQSVTNSANQSVVVVQNASAVTNSTGSLVLTFLVIN